MPRAGEVVGDLRQSFVGRSLTRPVPGGHAAADRLPDRPQPLHWIQPGRAVRRRKAIPPTVRPLTRRAGSSSSPSPARDRVLRPEASRGPARRCRPAAPRPCDVSRRHRCSPPTPGRPPAPAGYAARSRLPGWSCAAAAAQQTVKDRPVHPRPAPALNRHRVRQQVPRLIRGQVDAQPQHLSRLTRHPRRRRPPRPAQRRDAKAGPPRPASPRCQHPYVAGSCTLPLPRHALPSSQKPHAMARTARICGKTCRPAIPKASPRTLAVAGRSASAIPSCRRRRILSDTADRPLAALDAISPRSGRNAHPARPCGCRWDSRFAVDHWTWGKSADTAIPASPKRKRIGLGGCRRRPHRAVSAGKLSAGL